MHGWLLSLGLTVFDIGYLLIMALISIVMAILFNLAVIPTVKGSVAKKLWAYTHAVVVNATVTLVLITTALILFRNWEHLWK